MSLPPALRAVARTPEFWAAYFFCDGADELDFDFDTCAMDLPVAGKLGLRVWIDGSVEDVQLELLDPSGSEPVQLGWWDYAHWHPHALRWTEVDLVGRWVALTQPELRHPGLPVLLLSRFAPIIDAADAEVAEPLLAAALRSIPALPALLPATAVGLPDHPISEAYLDANDLRDTGVAWRTGTGTGPYPATLGDDAGVYSLRHPENDKFPFTMLAALVGQAGARCAAVADPAWLHPSAVLPTAREIADTGDLGAAPRLGDALRAAGCDHPVVLTALSKPIVPAEAWWVLELLLSERPGRLVGRWLAALDAGPRRAEHLTLRLPTGVADVPVSTLHLRRLVADLDRRLRAQGLGSAEVSGQIKQSLDDGSSVTEALLIDVTARGDINRVVEIIRRVVVVANLPQVAVLDGDALPDGRVLMP